MKFIELIKGIEKAKKDEAYLRINYGNNINSVARIKYTGDDYIVISAGGNDRVIPISQINFIEEIADKSLYYFNQE